MAVAAMSSRARRHCASAQAAREVRRGERASRRRPRSPWSMTARPRGDDGDAAGPRGLRPRLQPDRRHDRPPAEIAVARDRRASDGIELRMWLADAAPRRRRPPPPPRRSDRLRPLRHRQPRRGARPPAGRRDRSFAPDEIMAGARVHATAQPSTGTRAVHAAASDRPATASSRCARMSAATTRSTSWPARWRRGTVGGRGGLGILTSRVSVEMVQKAAALGAPSGRGLGADRARAPHRRGRRHHPVAVARDDGFEIFTHPQRIANAAPCRLHVA